MGRPNFYLKIRIVFSSLWSQLKLLAQQILAVKDIEERKWLPLPPRSFSLSIFTPTNTPGCKYSRAVTRVPSGDPLTTLDIGVPINDLRESAPGMLTLENEGLEWNKSIYKGLDEEEGWEELHKVHGRVRCFLHFVSFKL